jgi:hypothetical protein
MYIYMYIYDRRSSGYNNNHYDESTEYDDENNGISLKSVNIALNDQFATTRKSANTRGDNRKSTIWNESLKTKVLLASYVLHLKRVLFVIKLLHKCFELMPYRLDFT